MQNDEAHPPGWLLFDNLVIDGFGETLIEPLLERCPRVRIIVTSRRRLGLERETESPIPPLRMPDMAGEVTEVDLERDEAVALFFDRATSVWPGMPRSLATSIAAAEICRRLNGNPLAIEVVAARVRHFPPDILLRRFERYQVTWQMHSSTNDVFDAVRWSVSILDNDDLQRLRALTVLTDDFSIDAARSILNGIDSRTTSDYRDDEFLERCVGLRLMRSIQVGDFVYLTLPEPVRVALTDSSSPVDRTPASRETHAAWYQNEAQRRCPLLRGAHQELWLADIEREAHNYRAALTWLLDSSQTQRAASMIVSMGRFWASQVNVAEGISWIERTRVSGGDFIEPSTHGELLGLLSWLLLLRGELERARTVANDSLHEFQKAGDDAGMAGALDSVGELALSQRDFEVSADRFQQSLRMWRTLNDGWHEAMTLMSLGCVQLNLGDIRQAASSYRDAWALMEAADDERGATVARLGAAWLGLHTGNTLEARATARSSLPVFQKLRSPIEVAEALELLAAVEDSLAHRAEAARLFGAAEEERRGIGVDPHFWSRMGHFAEREVLRVRLLDPRFEADRQDGAAHWRSTLVEGAAATAIVWAERE